jgi:MtN3 and saliva related transmembrane protein
MPISPEVFGSIGGVLTTICFIPQAIKLIRTRHTEGVSVLMYATFTLGVLFWLVYGIMLNSTPMIVANSVTLALSVTILAVLVKEYFRKR